MIANLAISFLLVVVASNYCSAIVNVPLCASETNNARSQNGRLPGLRYNAQLADAAAAHNKVMISENCFTHQCPNEAGLAARLTSGGKKWLNFGENIAVGRYANCQAVVAQWISSPGHRAQLLNKSFTQFGCAVGTDKANKKFWTCVYGA